MAWLYGARTPLWNIWATAGSEQVPTFFLQTDFPKAGLSLPPHFLSPAASPQQQLHTTCWGAVNALPVCLPTSLSSHFAQLLQKKTFPAISFHVKTTYITHLKVTRWKEREQKKKRDFLQISAAMSSHVSEARFTCRHSFQPERVEGMPASEPKRRSVYRHLHFQGAAW